MKSDEYWALRALQREAEAHDGTTDSLKRLAVMYGDADKELVRMIDCVFQNFQKYAAVDEQKARELLSVQETAELLAELQKQFEETGNAEALAKLNAPAYGYRISRLQATRRAIEAELDKLAGQEEANGSQQLVKTYDDSYYKTMYDTLPDKPDAPVVPLSPGVVSQALQNTWKGENYSSRVWKNRDVLVSEGGKIIDAGVTAGKSIQQMTTELSDLMDVGSYAAARLLRTEVNRMHNDAAVQSYKAMRMKEYTYLATLDARTCAVCGALDLKVFKVAEAKTGVNLPPMHPNDRCTIAPKIPGAEADGERIARDPETGRNYKVPVGMTYEDWRKSISEKYGADSLEKAQKKYLNRKADAGQLKNLKKVLGKNAPKDLAELQNWKYNEPEKWERLKTSKQDALNSKSFEEIQNLKGKLGNLETRLWYKAHDAKISDLIDKSQSLEQQARQAHELRNKFRTQARELMADIEKRKVLEKEHPNITFKQLLEHKKLKYGLTGDRAFKDIIRSSRTTNKLFDEKSGVK